MAPRASFTSRVSAGSRPDFSDSQDRSADVAAARPSPPLAPYVERYVGYRVTDVPAGVHRGLPSHNFTFIVSLEDPVQALRLPDGSGPRSLQAFVGGLHTSAAEIRRGGLEHGIAVDLTPFGARALLGLPAAELTGRVVGLEDVLGPPGAFLPERLRAASGWPARFALLDRVLRSALDERGVVPDWVRGAWQGMLAGPAGTGSDVSGLARAFGWSRRHFTERFGREIGLPPRQLARVLRFERSRAQVARAAGRAERPSLAAIALDCGFYDQAHMNREWRDLAGVAPTRWLADEHLSVQDAAPADGQAAST